MRRLALLLAGLGLTAGIAMVPAVSASAATTQGGNGQGQNQCGNQGGNGQGQSNTQCKPRLSLADLAGGISGTLNGSSLSATNLDRNGAGGAGTETLQTSTLNIEGFSNSACPESALINLCLDVSGTFTITTNAGTLSGTATGGIGEDVSESSAGPQLAPVAGELELTVTSGTGQFASMTGALEAAFQFPAVIGDGSFVGTITAG